MASIGTPTVTGERNFTVTCIGLEAGSTYQLWSWIKSSNTQHFTDRAKASSSSITFSVTLTSAYTVSDINDLDLRDAYGKYITNRNVSMHYSPSIATPSTPSSISYSTSINSYNSTRISWGSVSGATSYVLERSINGGSFSQVYSGTATSYTDYGLNSSTTRVQYRVKAVNSGGSSSYKTGSSATVYYSKPNVAPIVMGICRDINWKNP